MKWENWGTAFNRMAESLQAIESLRKTLMINVAHELRTPLTNIQGYLEAMVDGVVPPSKDNFHLLHEETMRLVDSGGEHLASGQGGCGEGGPPQDRDPHRRS